MTRSMQKAHGTRTKRQKQLQKLLHKGFASALAMLIGLQPVMVQAQQVTAAQNAAAGNRPAVEAAGNGVPLVNIVTPNGAGLSHNRYGEFNVGQPGLILNNSAEELSRSQLGGLVQGNANLRTSGPARVILNEVVGSNRSLLRGAVEVHGRAADVIVANPNGLTCDGCGFINTPRVTLSTGTPELDASGALANLRVEGGDIRIGANGADLGSVDIFDIVSRQISVEGPVSAGGDLNLIAGRNLYAWQTGLITPLASDGDEPGIAIDSSLLGGMYAGRIKLVSTDRGAGVTMASDMAANAGQMTLTADGRLVMGKARAAKRVTVRSKARTVEVRKSIYSGDSIVIEGQSGVALAESALVASAGDVTLRGTKVRLAQGAVAAAGIDANGAQTASGTLSVDAGQFNAGDGQLLAGNQIQLDAELIDLRRASDTGVDTIRSLGGVDIRSNAIVAGNARMRSAGNFTVTSSGSLTLDKGDYAAVGGLLVQAADIDSSASLSSQDTVTLTASAGAIDNRGDVVGNGGLLISAAGALDNGATLASRRTVSVVSGGTVRNTGTGIIASAAGTDIQAGGLDNAGQIVAEAGDLSIAATGAVSNSGTISAKTTLDVTAGTAFGNSGRLIGDSGISVTAGGLLANSSQIMSLGAIALSSSNALENRSAGRIVAGYGIELDARSLDNAGTIANQGDALDVTVADDIENSGTFLSTGTASFKLDGDLDNAGDVLAEERLVIAGRTTDRAATVRNHSSGVINGGTVDLEAQSLINDGDLIAHDAELTADLSQSVVNRGTISGKSNLDLGFGQALDNNGDLIAEGELVVEGAPGASGGAITNRLDGVINGTNGLTVRAGSILNEGGIGSASGPLLVELAGNLDNRGLFYSGDSSSFRLDGAFTNTTADVLAETDLTIEGFSGLRGGGLINRSGTIETIGGDMTIRMASVANERPAPVIGQTSEQVVTYSGNPDRRPFNRVTHTWTTTTTTTTRDVVTDPGGAAARLLTGGHLEIDTGALVNSYSQIAANGDITIHAASVVNTGRDLIETVDEHNHHRHITGYCRRILGIGCFKYYRTRYTDDYATASSTYDAVYATIRAGGALNANVSGYVTNEAVRGRAGQIGLASGSRALDAANAAGASGIGALSGIATANGAGSGALPSANLTFSIDQLASRAALFTTQAAPNMPFLIETRSAFIDAGTFLGSDYFLSRIGGYDPNRTLRRLGDAYFESRLVRDQIFELTGNRTLLGGLDDRAQMQALYDNAIDVQRELDLRVGTALTPAQIAALTSDIVWMEEQIVNGETVLVPRLYLAAATLANIDPASARITGQQTGIEAAGLINSGTLAGVDGLAITTSEVAINAGGSLLSQANIVIDAGSLFVNRSGTVRAGGDIDVTADGIVVETAVTRDLYDNGLADRMQQLARMEAGGNLMLDASGSVTITGADLSAGEALAVSAGEEITVNALALEERFEDEFADGHDNRYSLTHRLSDLAAGTDATLAAGGDLTIGGATIKAGGDATLDAGGNVSITSVQNIESRDFDVSFETGGLLSMEVDHQEQSRTVETARSTVTAGGDLTVRSQTGDIALEAARLGAGGTATLQADEGRIVARANIDSAYERQSIDTEDLFWWTEKDAGHAIETLEQVEITAGGGIRIDAGEGLVVEYQKQGSFDGSIRELSKSPGLAWISDLRNDPALVGQIDWVGVETSFDEWDHEAQGLTEAGALIVSLAVTVATSGVLWGGESIFASMTSGIGNQALNAAAQAGLRTLTNQAAVALVNNQGDIGAALQELGSSANLRALATAIVTAGLSTAIIDGIGIAAPVAGASTPVDTFSYNLQTGLVRATVKATVSTAIEGGNLGEELFGGWTNTMVMAGLAATQHAIGDFAASHGLPDGALPKVLTHAVAGGIAQELAGGNFADGALAGALAEITGPLLGGSRLSASQQIELQRVIATAAVILRSGGDVDAAEFAGGVAASAHQNNYLKHDEIAALRGELERCPQTEGCDFHEVLERYRALSDENRTAMLQCTTPQCWEYHRQEILKSNVIARQIGSAASQAGRLTDEGSGAFHASELAAEENRISLARLPNPDQTAFGLTFADYRAAHCGGVHDAACMGDFQASRRHQSLRDALVATAEIVTPYGTVVEGYACATGAGAGACATAAASLLPTGAIVKLGGDIFVNATGGLMRATLRQTDTGTEAVTRSGEVVRVAPNNGADTYFGQQRRFWTDDPVQFNGNRVFQRNDQFDPNQVSTWRENGQNVQGTNLERMASGRAPIGNDGRPINLHHMTQTQGSAIAEVTETFHRQNFGTVHINTGNLPSGINRTEFDAWRADYWRDRAGSWGQ